MIKRNWNLIGMHSNWKIMYSVNIYHFVSYCHDNIDSMISKVEVIRKEFFLNDQLYYRHIMVSKFPIIFLNYN